MKFESLRQKLQVRPFFETPEIESLLEKPEHAALPRICRWISQGKLIQLRRGKYLLPSKYQVKSADPFFISNYLYRPSYVSLYTALEYYQLIPETVFGVQAVTTRQTAVWDTILGQFRYFSTTPERFFGYISVKLGDGEQQTALIAEPEKVLTDVCYFSSGEWTRSRWAELRLQNYATINPARLADYAKRMKNRRVERGIQCLISLLKNKKEV
jgi:predicted transcriptional regulator of viral defense system